MIGRQNADISNATKRILTRRPIFSLKPLPGLKKYPDITKNPTNPRYKAWIAGEGSDIPLLATMAKCSMTMKNIAKPLKTSIDLRRLRDTVSFDIGQQ